MRTLFLILSALLLVSCVSITNDIETRTLTNPDVNYSNYQTYSWGGSAKIVFDPIGQWEQPTLSTDEEVKFNINKELRNRGLFEVYNDPDLIVIFAAGIDMTTLELKEDPASEKKILKNIPKASLLIALIDATSGYTVWLGYAEGEIQEQQSIENIRTRIEYAVHEMFKNFNH